MSSVDKCLQDFNPLMSSDLWCHVLGVGDESSLQYPQARLSPGDQSHQTGNMLSSPPSSFVCMYSYPDHSYHREDPCVLTPSFPFAKGWSGSQYTGLTRAQSMSSKRILRRGLSSELSKQDASTFACDLHLLCIGPHKLCPHSQTSFTSYFKTVAIFD